MFHTEFRQTHECIHFALLNGRLQALSSASLVVVNNERIRVWNCKIYRYGQYLNIIPTLFYHPNIKRNIIKMLWTFESCKTSDHHTRLSNYLVHNKTGVKVNVFGEKNAFLLSL